MTRGKKEPYVTENGLVIRTDSKNSDLAHPTPDGLDLIRELAASGAQVGTIAKGLGVGYGTFMSMKNRIPEVAEAFAEGRAEIVTELTSLLMKNARDGNVTSILFALKTLGGWVEGQQIDGKRKEVPTVNIALPPAMTSEQFKKMMIDITPTKAEDE
jgi:hypothetical protein